MKILITGAHGLLGPYLLDAFDGHDIRCPPRSAIDLNDRADVKSLILDDMPDVVVHAAAMTNVDECDDEPLKAIAANRDTTHHIVEFLRPTSKMVYISTDMVYPDIPGPHVEPDARPINMYGRTKLAGEHCAKVNPRHLILRTNFFGPSKTPGRQSYSDFVIQTATDGPMRIFFNDVWWSPLHMQTLCTLILELVVDDVIGIYNLGSQNGTTKADFALCLIKHKGLQFGKFALGPSRFKVPRPKDLRLDCSRLMAMGYQLPKLEEEIAKL